MDEKKLSKENVAEYERPSEEDDEIAVGNEDTVGFAATKPRDVKNSRSFMKERKKGRKEGRKEGRKKDRRAFLSIVHGDSTGEPGEGGFAGAPGWSAARRGLLPSRFTLHVFQLLKQRCD